MPQRNPETPCPICSRATSYFLEPIGPFCSERCQMIDLGKWMAEEYRVSEPLRPDHFAAFAEGEGDDGSSSFRPPPGEKHDEL